MKGSHLKVYLNGKQCVIPMHKADLKKGNRLTNLRHTTRIDSIAAALHALGRHLEISVA